MMSRLGFDNRMGRVPATYGFDVGRGGNGYLVNVIPKTDFSFDGRAATPPAADQDVPIAVGIDSSAWVSGVILVRVHSKNLWSTTASLSILVQNIMIVPEEPDVVFASTTNLVSTAISITNGTVATAPALFVSSLATMGAQLRVLVRFSQGLTPAGAAQTIAIGVDLVGRPA
jgi:hypothetical protein